MKLSNLCGLLILGSTAWAQNANIIALGSPMKWGGQNSPDTYSDATTFSPAHVLVDGGKVEIWQEQVPTGTNGEWDIFHMKTVNGGPLAGNLGANWIVVMDYTTRVASSFDQVANQWLVDGRPVNSVSNFGTICCASLTNPILPGASYYNSGFNGPIPAGLQTNWQQIFVQPYTFANSGGIPTDRANEFTFALHFSLVPPAIPTISSVISAGAFGAFPSFAPGSWIEIYGTNFSVGTQQWGGSDFEGLVFAPTKIGGATVSIGGKAAYVNYVSPTQINVQVPSGVATGASTLTVTTPKGTSAPFAVNVESVKPGLLAPLSFKLGGTQNLVALFPDNATYVLPPGAINGVTSRRARAGDTIIVYGVGFGSVDKNIGPGQIAQQVNALTSPLVVRFGSAQATVSYGGLAPNFVGLYQFNIVVPSVSANDAVPVTFTLGGVAVTQTFSLAVGN
ncbi:MAG: IPT/TIG domain-containing protein [Bryobacteraceae bacterium]